MIQEYNDTRGLVQMAQRGDDVNCKQALGCMGAGSVLKSQVKFNSGGQEQCSRSTQGQGPSSFKVLREGKIRVSVHSNITVLLVYTKSSFSART